MFGGLPASYQGEVEINWLAVHLVWRSAKALSLFFLHPFRVNTFCGTEHNNCHNLKCSLNINYRVTNLQLNPVKLIKTGPGPWLSQTLEELSHGFIVQPIRAVENYTLWTQITNTAGMQLRNCQNPLYNYKPLVKTLHRTENDKSHQCKILKLLTVDTNPSNYNALVKHCTELKTINPTNAKF